jgi:hypothetical protein
MHHEDQLNDITQYDLHKGIEKKFYDDLADSNFIGHHISDKKTRRLIIQNDWEINVQYTHQAVPPVKWAYKPTKEVTLFEREDISIHSTVKNEEPDDKNLVLPSDNIDQKIKNFTIRYENDTQITIQPKNKPRISVDLTQLTQVRHFFTQRG